MVFFAGLFRQRRQPLAVFRMPELLKPMADQVLRSVAHNAFSRRADVHDASFGIVQRHQIGHVFGQQPEELLALAQFCLSLAGFGHVPKDDGHPFVETGGRHFKPQGAFGLFQTEGPSQRLAPLHHLHACLEKARQRCLGEHFAQPPAFQLRLP